jgi:hypothetical protein
MASKQQMAHVAVECPGYEPMREHLVSTIGAEGGVSCGNCHNWQNERCVVNLFDKVLSSLDQT